METRRYTEVQVFRVLQEVDSGTPVIDAAQKVWSLVSNDSPLENKYGGMTLSELKRLKALEEENARLKRIVAQQALDNELLKEINSKKQ